ncbi:MAG: Fe(3+) ABC transporter substrate-binding protein [Alphaproteobacteria bacterium]|nr:Fe(3+) ABC transporter substrate-binding protein [Alphaproteobacteria bacterium]
MITHTTSRRFLLGLTAAALTGALGLPAMSQEQVLNLYSARHYQTDEALYANFTRQTGIRINRIEAKEDEIIERIRNEGANSPADVLLTVDVGRLWRADQFGLFAPVKSAVLESRIPAHLRHPDGHWFGFSTRARVIFYNKDKVGQGEVANYEDLADPKHKGKVCIRSGGNIYNLSLLSALIQHWGEAKAEAWARGVVANFARPPKGGDTDQIKAVASGECALAVANTYYFVRLMRSDKPEDKAVVSRIGVVFPNQAKQGTHVNVAGGGLVKTAPNREAAVRFLEYLASDEAQAYFANGNNEYPVVARVLDNAELSSLGDFNTDKLNVDFLGRNQPKAQMIFDRVGWK